MTATDYQLAVLVAFLFLAVALVSGNNLSACIGTLVGSGIVGKNFAILIGAIGFVAGLALEGPNMRYTVRSLIPGLNLSLAIEILLVTIFLFAAAKLIRVPASLSMSLSGLMIGLSVARGFQISQPFVERLVIAWAAAPFLSILTVFFSIKVLTRMNPKDIWRRIRIYKITLLLASFFAALALGANTIGLIVTIGGFNAMDITIAIVAIFFGTFFLSAGAIKSIGQDVFALRYSNAMIALFVSTLLVEVATFFSIPISSTQTLASGVFGAGLSYKYRYIAIRPFLVVAASWVMMPSLAFLLGLIL
ncbi:MAG: inorganic phosphate transporter [Nitrososphaerota archaeon]|nr:inorganic phosphate transporter [Nitrososphaerota archaeon]